MGLLEKVNKSKFMFTKLIRDWNLNKDLIINLDVHNPVLSEYYFVFGDQKEKLNRLISSFDEKGVPLNSTYIDVNDSKLYYYPISIGQYGLGVYHGYIKDKSQEKQRLFLNIADWFVENAKQSKELGAYWLTEVPKPEFNVHQPWPSAFSQSRALSILLRAYQITKDKTYLDLSSLALIPFKKVPI